MDDQRLEHEAAGRPSEQMTDAEILAAVAYCAGCWEPGVRLLANLRAADIVRALSSQAEELDRLKKALDEERADGDESCDKMMSAEDALKRAEAELLSLREELAGVKANWELDQRVLDRTKTERDRLVLERDEARQMTEERSRAFVQYPFALKRAEAAELELQQLREGIREKLEALWGICWGYCTDLMPMDALGEERRDVEVKRLLAPQAKEPRKDT